MSRLKLYPKRGPKRDLDAEGIRKPLGKPLESLLDPLGLFLDTLGTLVDALTTLLDLKRTETRPAAPQPDQVLRPESTDVITCLRPVIMCPCPSNHLPTSV